ncbi:MAG: hypothetical protein EOP88_11220 [Verrucomicrobiaceae bacterium]|nr:MAG: hypothetical protein EOP88_11220 [Verrucomicrobiaceae bacterium]
MNHSLTPYLVVTTVLLAIRHGWRDLQADRAIRRELEDKPVMVLRIGRASLLREGGQRRGTFLSSLSHREYEVRFRAEDGRERTQTFVADFHPVTGALRGIHRLGEGGGGGDGSAPLASAP